MSVEDPSQSVCNRKQDYIQDADHKLSFQCRSLAETSNLMDVTTHCQKALDETAYVNESLDKSMMRQFPVRLKDRSGEVYMQLEHLAVNSREDEKNKLKFRQSLKAIVDIVLPGYDPDFDRFEPPSQEGDSYLMFQQTFQVNKVFEFKAIFDKWSQMG